MLGDESSSAFSYHSWLTFLSFFDLLDTDVFELNQRPMTKKTYVPFAWSLKATDIIVFENDGAV